MEPSSPSTSLCLSSEFNSGSYDRSWPNSCTSSPKKTAVSSSSCPSSPFSDSCFLVDCTLSLGNASTRRSPSSSADALHEAPSRLSRAGSPVSGSRIDLPSSDYYLQTQWQKMNTSLRGYPTSEQPGLPRFNRMDSTLYSRQQQSFPQELNKFGFLEYSTEPRSRFRESSQNDPRNVPRICAHCGTNSTPLWRNGPLGPKSLCNACGIRFKKVGRRSPVGAYPSNSWGFQASGSEQDKRCRVESSIPYAVESSPSPSSSNAIGSCITWQHMRPSAAAPLVLDAEVIRSLPVAEPVNSHQNKDEQGNFLRMSLS